MEEALQLDYACSPSTSRKRLRVTNLPVSTPKDTYAFTTDIRPWNIHSEPIMSQLTCDVKTCPNGQLSEKYHRKDSLAGNGNCTESSKSPCVTVRKKNQKLHVAYDVLDPVEFRALEKLHQEGIFQVVLGGIHAIAKDIGRDDSFFPFPAVLITHAFDKSRFGSEKQSVCYRSYTYLKAKALGARIIDARWLLDTQNAGMLLDCENYLIWSDLESCNNRMTAGKGSHATVTASKTVVTQVSSRMPSHKFGGITFGLVHGLELIPSPEPSESNCQPTNSQLRVVSKPMTVQEIESLVRCWGGRITIDTLTQMDILLVDDQMTLGQISKSLKHTLRANIDVRCWSIEKWGKDELQDFIVSGNLTSVCGEGIHARIPITRTKWLEESICANSLRSFTTYCWGILCL